MREQTVAIGALTLDCGETLPNVEQRLTLYGDARNDGSNVVLVTHALTGSSRVADWWAGIVGEGALFDPRSWCIVGVNTQDFVAHSWQRPASGNKPCSRSCSRTANAARPAFALLD